MRSYELVLVIKASLSEAQQKKLTDTVKGWLGDVKIAKSEDWGKKPLAYPIKREESGVFFDWHLDAKEAIPKDFEKRILNNEDVLRHLLIRKK